MAANIKQIANIANVLLGTEHLYLSLTSSMSTTISFSLFRFPIGHIGPLSIDR